MSRAVFEDVAFFPLPLAYIYNVCFLNFFLFKLINVRSAGKQNESSAFLMSYPLTAGKTESKIDLMFLWSISQVCETWPWLIPSLDV